MIKTGYKLFEQDQEGNLHPLFIGKKEIIPIGKWVEAENLPTKGYAQRPGWHLGNIPSAYWLMSADGTYKSQRSKYWQRVWCEVQYVAEIDYTSEVQIMPKKCFQNKIPTNGFYLFKEAGLGRIWIICDRIKVTKILSEAERIKFLQDMDFDESILVEKHLKKYKNKL